MELKDFAQQLYLQDIRRRLCKKHGLMRGNIKKEFDFYTSRIIPEYQAFNIVGRRSGCSDHVLCKDDHSYLPALGFNFTIERTILTSLPVYLSSENVSAKIMGVSGGETKLLIDVRTIEERDFFAVLAAIRAGDRFVPFSVIAEKDIIRKMETRYKISFEAFVADDKVKADLTGLTTANFHDGGTDIEKVVDQCISLFDNEIVTFEELEPFCDGSGATQKYYQLRKRIGRALLGKVREILFNHQIPHGMTWGMKNRIRSIVG